MFLRSKSRIKDGKVHRYWSVVENRRVRDGRVVQRQVLYLGEINGSQACGLEPELDRGFCRRPGDKPQSDCRYLPEGKSVPDVRRCEVVQVRVGATCGYVVPDNGVAAGWLPEIWDQLELDKLLAGEALCRPGRKRTPAG